MKTAYLMLVHRNPRLLQRAIQVLSSEECAFFVHVDQKSDIREFSSIAGDNVFFSGPRTAVYWGEFSQVEATLNLLEQALACPASYNYFALLHGSDYPLRSGSYIQHFLERNRGSEFISMVKVPAPGYPLSKVTKLRYPSAKPIRRFASRALAKLGLARRDYKKYLGNLAAYAGDACWVLSRDACQYIVEFVKCHPEVARYFRYTFTSDETFFHTILGNSAFLPRVRKSLLYTYWPNPGNHPEMLGDAQVSFFENQQKVWVEDQFGAGEALFARKFSDDNLELLNRMDAMIRRREQHVRSN